MDPNNPLDPMNLNSPLHPLNPLNPASPISLFNSSNDSSSSSSSSITTNSATIETGSSSNPSSQVKNPQQKKLSVIDKKTLKGVGIFAGLTISFLPISIVLGVLTALVNGLEFVHVIVAFLALASTAVLAGSLTLMLICMGLNMVATALLTDW